MKRYLRARRSGIGYVYHINAVQVGFGEGLYVDAAAFAGDVIDEIPGVGSLADCLEARDT